MRKQGVRCAPTACGCMQTHGMEITQGGSEKAAAFTFWNGTIFLLYRFTGVRGNAGALAKDKQHPLCSGAAGVFNRKAR